MPNALLEQISDGGGVKEGVGQPVAPELPLRVVLALKLHESVRNTQHAVKEAQKTSTCFIVGERTNHQRNLSWCCDRCCLDNRGGRSCQRIVADSTAYDSANLHG